MSIQDDVKAVRAWLNAGIVPPEYEETWTRGLKQFEVMRKELCRTQSVLGENELLKARLERYEKALDESVKLQSHYATLLNQYDGGKRIVFISAESFLNRLEALEGNG